MKNPTEIKSPEEILKEAQEKKTPWYYRIPIIGNFLKDVDTTTNQVNH